MCIAMFYSWVDVFAVPDKREDPSRICADSKNRFRNENSVRTEVGMFYLMF